MRLTTGQGLASEPQAASAARQAPPAPPDLTHEPSDDLRWAGRRRLDNMALQGEEVVRLARVLEHEPEGAVVWLWGWLPGGPAWPPAHTTSQTLWIVQPLHPRGLEAMDARLAPLLSSDTGRATAWVQALLMRPDAARELPRTLRAAVAGANPILRAGALAAHVWPEATVAERLRVETDAGVHTALLAQPHVPRAVTDPLMEELEQAIAQLRPGRRIEAYDAAWRAAQELQARSVPQGAEAAGRPDPARARVLSYDTRIEYLGLHRHYRTRLLELLAPLDWVPLSLTALVHQAFSVRRGPKGHRIHPDRTVVTADELDAMIEQARRGRPADPQAVPLFHLELLADPDLSPARWGRRLLHVLVAGHDPRRVLEARPPQLSAAMADPTLAAQLLSGPNRAVRLAALEARARLGRPEGGRPTPATGSRPVRG